MPRSGLLCAAVAAFLLLALPAAADGIAIQLESRVAAERGGPAGGLGRPELLAIQKFYAERAFAPVWLEAGRPGGRARTLARLLAGAEADGLDPADYGAPTIAALLDAKTPKELAGLEYLLSDGLLRLVHDLEAGRVRPNEVDDEHFVYPRATDPAAVLAGAAGTSDIAAYVAGFAPPSREYARLRDALADYRKLAAAGGWGTVPVGETLKPGMTGELVRKLRERLVRGGDLAPEAAAGDAYDETLEAAVRRFQDRHGLTVDGVVGPGTLAALNVPVERRIALMLLNLERRRWMPSDLGRRYVFVNLADFELKVVDGPRTIHDTRVVVGKPYHRTPVFSGEMTYIVLNPYWNVPPSIAVNEILPKLKKNPGYLASQNIRVFGDWSGQGSEIEPTSIDWSQVGPRGFPYKLRQEPGEQNALGRIKFMFPNRHNIYLHDTPSRELFRRTVRSFSHGCIRVENPVELAAVLLRDDPDWPRERLDRLLADDAQDIVNLKAPIPVHLTYLTAWVNKDGTVHFRDDVYGRDKRLAAALERAAREPRRAI